MLITCWHIPINRFYIANERIDLLENLRYPSNVFDNFIRVEQMNAELRAQQAENKAQNSTEALKSIQAKFKHPLDMEKVCDLEMQQAVNKTSSLEDSGTSFLLTNQKYYAELKAVREELNTDHKWNLHHCMLAEQRNKQLQELISSSSWRMTAPFRHTKALFSSALGRILRRVVRKGKVLARRMPLFKRLAFWVMGRFPVFEQVIGSFSDTPFSAAHAKRLQIRQFEHLRSVCIMQALSQYCPNDAEGPVHFLKVHDDAN